jgi:hypothetical protein
MFCFVLTCCTKKSFLLFHAIGKQAKSFDTQDKQPKSFDTQDEPSGTDICFSLELIVLYIVSSAENIKMNGEIEAASQPRTSRVRSGLSHARSALDKKRIVFQKKAKRRYRIIERNLRKKKQTVIQWLGSGVSHYYLKFLGLWKPETSMGVVADVARLQDEQHRVMMKLILKAELQRNDPNPSIPKIPFHVKDNAE